MLKNSETPPDHLALGMKIHHLEKFKRFLKADPVCVRLKPLGVVYSFKSKKTVAMAMNYDNLWKLLIDKKMNRTDRHKQAHISTNAVAAMGKGEDVSTQVLNKICRSLDCRIEDIVTCVPDEEN